MCTFKPENLCFKPACKVSLSPFFQPGKIRLIYPDGLTYPFSNLSAELLNGKVSKFSKRKFLRAG